MHKAKHVVLATGTIVSKLAGAPNPWDIAIAITRIPRFAGNGIIWMPVGIHTFVVADLLPPRLKVYGLLHDGPEVVGNDVPKPVKPKAVSKREDLIGERTLEALGLPALSAADAEAVKHADNLALLGEVWTTGPIHLRKEYLQCERIPELEELVLYYVKKYPGWMCLQYAGPVAREFNRRYRKYKALFDEQGSTAIAGAPAPIHTGT